jgi:hypothetical protein
MDYKWCSDEYWKRHCSVEEEAKKEPFDEYEGLFPDIEYPSLPILEEQAPDDLPCAEDQETPAEDEWYCPLCGNSPCQFLQWQEGLERIVDIMYAEVTNKAKRYQMYRHMS